MTDETTPFGIDGNGVLTEVRVIDGREFCVHYDDIAAPDMASRRGAHLLRALLAR